MDSLVALNLSLLAVLALAGIGAAFMLLRGMDKLNGISFKKDVYSKISESPVAMSIYFGMRFFGVLYVISALFSRFV